MFTSIFFVVVYYGICLMGLFFSGLREQLRDIRQSISIKTALIFLGLLLAFIAFILFCTGRNHYIYFWDNAGYWTFSINRMKYIYENSFVDSIASLMESINNDDYNFFLPSVISLPLHIIGYTYRRYVIVNCICFLIPTYLVFGLTISKITNNAKYSIITAVALAFIFCQNYYAVFVGYIDVGYLLPMAITLYIFVDYPWGQLNVLRNVGIALMLILMWICRRYAIYYVVGFVFLLLLNLVYENVKERKISFVGKSILNYLMVGIFSCGILLLAFRDFFLNALFTDYGEMYSAYDAPLAGKIESLRCGFGGIMLCIVILSGLICIIYKRHFRLFFLMVSMIIVELFVFWMTQNMGEHHRMILNLPLMVISALPFCVLLEKNTLDEQNRKITLVNTVSVLIAIVLCINFGRAFSTITVNENTKIWSVKYYPQVRNDIDVLFEIADTVNVLTEGTYSTVYVAASGTILNADIMRKLNMPITDNYVNNLESTSDVDLRDGFPASFLYASYIITTDPVQLHLGSGQEVVSYLASELQNEESHIGKHYTLLKEFPLDYGVTAKLYIKQSEYEEEDLEKIREHYSELYPDYNDMFVDRIHL